MNRQPAVFFDRDGTLMEEVDYCRDPKLVLAFPGVQQALEKLHARGFKNVIVTNQSGIGRGRITPAEYEAVHAALLDQIGAHTIDATYFCPDVPGPPSTHRKPEPGMVLDAARDLNLDLGRSFFVGDKNSDIECGKRAGVRTILVETGYGKDQDSSPDFRTKGVVEAVERILAQAPE